MLNKILVTLDGSELAEKVIPYVKKIAGKLDNEVVLFSVCPNKGAEHCICEYLGEKTDELQAIGIKAKPIVTTGDASNQIVDFSEKNGIGLIMMSTHGSTGISRWNAGSVSNKVMHESYVPLLLVKAMSSKNGLNGNGKTMVLLDGSRFSEASIPYVINLADAFTNETVLFRVNEAAEFHGEMVPELIPYWEQFRKEALSRTGESINRYLENMKTLIGMDGLNVSWKTATGKAADEIIKYAESNDIALVAMSTHGYSGFNHWAFGSVANKVVEGISRPVLLIRTKPTILDSPA